MKRLFFVVISVCALFVPAVAGAQDTTLVYRPELRAYVPVPAPAKPAAVPAALTPPETIARHEAMSRGHRVQPRANAAAAVHCDRMVHEATEAARRAN